MGVPDLDRGEREAVQSTLGDVPVAAPIAAIGHCGAASGMLGLVTGVAAIASGTIPGTRNAATAAPEAGLLREPRRLEQPRVLCLAHTSEGNATAVLLASS
jgi:3-oxoacyl-[acyl-carrier-protein] synthase II